MTDISSQHGSASRSSARRNYSWRVVDIVVAGLIAVAGGVIFWAWSQGAALVSAMEGEIRRRGGRLVRVETSAMEAYGPTRGFYQAMKYQEEGRFRDFYKHGEDLIILSKRM